MVRQVRFWSEDGDGDELEKCYVLRVRCKEPGELIEVSLSVGNRLEKVLTAIRIVP